MMRPTSGRIRIALGLLAVLGALSLGLAPVRVLAQEQTPLVVSRLQVQVMPEFDDPRVLVIVQGRLALADSDLPVDLTVLVPRGAQINQMAAMDMTSGGTVSKAYEAVPDPADERWSQVTYTLDNPHFFYEYYYDPLEGDPEKQFTFEFVSLQAVDDLMIEVQQPSAATNFSTVPSPTVARSDNNDLTFHQLPIGALAAGGEVTVEVRYTKAGSEPSISRAEAMAQAQQQTGAAQTASPTVATAQPTDEMPLWGWALLGGGFIAGGAVLWQRQKASAPAPVSAPVVAAPMETSGTASEAVALDVRFCPKCGTAFKGDARFCHYCGTSRQAGATTERSSS